MTRPSYRRQRRIFARALQFAALVGAAFGAVAGGVVLHPPLLGMGLGALSGAVDAAALMATIGCSEIFLPRTRFGRALRRAPLVLVLAAKVVVYLPVAAAVLVCELGPRAAALVAGPETAQEFARQIQSGPPPGLSFAIVGMAVYFILLLRQSTLLMGECSAGGIALGDYRRPRAEERFFLFIDIVGSTPVTERLGPLPVHAYLDGIFQLASDPVDEHDGDVYQYVGDEMVITWTVANGRAGARPLACLFAIEAALARAAPEFEREFGTVPRMRAALHAGTVVTGEVGGSRRAIVFHGDVMNATSRMENLTRTLGHPFLVSEEARARMDGAESYAFTDLGPQELRGKQAPVRVYAVASTAA